ncbi:AAA family ATPase [Nocardioides humilatus]|uniref:AAA family ATPase n=1 Tax=Nocardioides humilatus TaxID=2607660 RepID=A0A5B1LF19_9ACTN|nr:LuxR family transcriptional regulator [Nocardioides humilatus]KAA1419232.1 AAA family ATPase [Nocardioides humilatus]
MVVIGRDDELSTLLALVDRLPDSGPATATVVAAAGMGKSALAVAFRDALLDRDVTLLTSRPLEAEGQLSFSALGDLFDPLPEEEYDDLPAPQRAAIRSALLLDDGDGAEPRAVALAVRGVLRNQASKQPVIVLVDDAQWVDDASAAALSQSLPRLTDVPVLVVAWARPSGRPVGDWLPDWPRTELGLDPLPLSAIFHVVQHHLDVTLTRSELRAVGEASGGNPLHALEFARHRAHGPGASFEGLLTERIIGLPRPTRRALLATALCAAPTATRLAEALGGTVEELLDDLEPAVAGGLIRLGSLINFQHPLYLEAAIDSVAAEEQVAMHEALSRVEPLEEARVRHRALADTAPDEALAAELTEASRKAWARAAWLAATELLRLAIARSEDRAARDQRALELARRLVLNGDPQDAAQILTDLRATPGGPSYWAATVELCKLHTLNEQYDDAKSLARELDAADLSPEDYARAVVEGEIDMLLGRRETINESYEEALRRLESEPDRPGLSALRAAVLVPLAYHRYQEALPFQDLIDEAVELDEREPMERIAYGPLMMAAIHQMTSGRFDEARQGFGAILRASLESGDDLAVPVIYSYLGSLEARACRFDEARRQAEEGLVAAASMPGFLPMITNILVSIDVHVGNVERALARSDEVREMHGTLDDPSQEATWSVGRMAALVAAGRMEEAYEFSVRIRELVDRLGLRHPADPMIAPTILDVLLETGRLDEAEDYLADVRARARKIDLEAMLAELVRHEVTLTAARGDLDAAAAMVPAMIAGLDELPSGMVVQPVERARAWWAAGKVFRRGRSRRQATEALEKAVEIFEEIGCTRRAALARADLDRTGSRRSKTVLTEAELAVARAAAAGRRNNEIAEQLFLSVKTVESLLTRCYRKLGIRSRVELAGALERMTTDD